MTCSFQEALKNYDVYARARGFTAPTIEHTRRCVALFDQFLGSNRAVGEVTVSDFRRFIADLRERPVRNAKQTAKAHMLSGTSVNTYARAIRAFFSWLKTEGLIATNPLESERPPKKPHIIPKVYSEDQLKAIFRAVARDLRNKAIVFWLVDSGPRLSEVCNADMDRVDTHAGMAKIMGKGQKERTVPFRSDTAAAIDAYVKNARPAPRGPNRLFMTEKGAPLHPSGIQSMLDRLGREAGLAERLSPHKLRHTFATLAVKYGGNLEYIRIILGHSDIKTTNAYVNADISDVKAAHDRFSPLANLIHGAESENTATPPPQARPAVESPAPGAAPEKKAQPKSTKESPARNYLTLSGARREEGADKGQTVGVDSVSPPFRELYRRHLARLATVAGHLVGDIEQGRLEEPRATPTGGAFPGVNLGRVFHSQNDRLWPFLSRHLDNEFPSLTREITELAVNARLDRLLARPRTKTRLAEEVRAKLVIVSERGTFEGTCDVCRKYFRGPVLHAENAERS